MSPDFDKPFPDMTERELYIQQATLLKELCKAVRELKKENTTDHAELFDKVDKTIFGKISNRLFYWVLGIVTIVLLSLTQYTSKIGGISMINASDIKNIKERINIYHSNKRWNDKGWSSNGINTDK